MNPQVPHYEMGITSPPMSYYASKWKYSFPLVLGTEEMLNSRLLLPLLLPKLDKCDRKRKYIIFSDFFSPLILWSLWGPSYQSSWCHLPNSLLPISAPLHIFLDNGLYSHLSHCRSPPTTRSSLSYTPFFCDPAFYSDNWVF